eukprot:64214_1
MATDSDITNTYEKFKKAQFDLDFGEDITKQYFTDYFKNNDIEQHTIQTIYNSITKQNKDYLTTKEFFDWQREQCTKHLIQDLISNNNKPSQNNNNNKQDNEWSKSYEIKFDLYEDQSNNDQNNETQETKKDTTQPPTSANNEDNTNNENDKKENDTEIVYGDSPEIKEETKPTNVMSKPPPMNIRVSADFAGFIDAHTPRKSPTSQNINFSPKSEKKEDINIASQTTPLSIGTEKINFSTYPQTPSKSQKSMNRVNIFLTNDSDEEKEEEDLDIKDIENEIREQKQFRCMECI